MTRVNLIFFCRNKYLDGVNEWWKFITEKWNVEANWTNKALWTEDILHTKYFFQIKQCSNGTVWVERIKIRLLYQKSRNYILCRENFFKWLMFLLGIHQEINRRAAINQVRERVISLWTQIIKQHSRPDPKSFLDFPITYKIFPFLFLILLTVLILKPLLQEGHFYLHWQENTSFECCRDYQGVARVARVRFCNKIAETMLQNIHWICKMLRILGTPGHASNRHRLLSQNGLEDAQFPVRVENRRRSSGFRIES